MVERSLAATVRTYEQLRKRGIRVVIGGDYGFDITPQGANARDIEHFVELLRYSPSEALACATRVGAELMDMGHELGQVREGYLADLLLVDGDPLADASILQRQESARGHHAERQLPQASIAMRARAPARPHDRIGTN